MRKNFKATTTIAPCPVLVIASYDDDKNVDVMTAAWGGVYDGGMVNICLSANHKTTANIKSRGAFTISFADATHVEEADYFGLVSGNDNINKLKTVGFHSHASELVDAPIIDEFPITLECVVDKIVDIDEETNSIIACVANLSADESVLDDQGKIDLGKAKLVSYDTFNHSYRLVGDIVSMAYSCGKKFIK